MKRNVLSSFLQWISSVLTYSTESLSFAPISAVFNIWENRLTNSIQHKAFVKLIGLQYKIQYKPDSSNVAADALSRCVTKMVGAISSCAPSWQENLVVGYHDNEEDKKLLAALSMSGTHHVGFSLVDGLIRFKSRI
jgi:hypothetical protein